MQNTGRCMAGAGGVLKGMTQLATTHVHIYDIFKLSSLKGNDGGLESHKQP